MAVIPSLPITLQNGTTADATQVMANFNAIVSAVNANAAGSGINTNITQLLGLTVAVAVNQGGTGAQILTPNGVLIGQGTGNVTAIGPAAAGTVLTSNGAGVNPSYQTTIPSGCMVWWPLSTPPVGFIEANGQSTAPYINLIPIFGATVPDVRGRFIRAWDDGAGVDPGRALLSLQADGIASHTVATVVTDPGHSHVINVATSSFVCSGSGANFALTSFGSTSQTSTTGITVTASYTGTSETRPKNLALMLIIKT